MIVYNDIISGDEMMTDAFPQEKVLDKDGNVVEGLFGVKSSTMSKGGENVDVGCGSAFGGSEEVLDDSCLLYTSPSPRDATLSRMPSSA